MGWSGFLLRFLFSSILVFSTYNPEYSYIHWLRDSLSEISAFLVFAGVCLVIGWTIYLRATLRSLGAFGLALAIAFFASLIWLLIDWGLIASENTRLMSYISLFILSAVLAVGMCWSHVRRQLSGQSDVDDIEE